MKCFLWILLAVFAVVSARAEDRVLKDLVFAEVDGQELKLDLHFPAGVESPPLAVWIHGGGWKGGSKDKLHAGWLIEEGYAVASISYRLSDVAVFPAQIHDCKGAVRWLRANAQAHGYDASRIVVAGSSAGGMLAALMATSGGVEALEGATGGHLDQSSRVDAAIDYYGPTDFLLRSKTQPAKTEDPSGSVFKLLGGKASEKRDLAAAASAVTHVSRDDPPMLVLHGTKDKTVYLDQSEAICAAYRKAGLDTELVIVAEGGHGGAAFFKGVGRTRAVAFLNRVMKAKGDAGKRPPASAK